MSNKMNIKPIHLVLVGLAIIILGVLIPSFFISPFSTMGFSVILGSIILLLAYAFFAANMVKSKGNKVIKWLAAPALAVLLVGGAFIANGAYQQSLNNKIYSPNSNVEFSDFILQLSSPSYSEPPLEMPQEKIKAFGDINTPEDCSKYPFLSWRENNIDITSFDYDDNAYEKANPSGRYCEWRNDSRKKIQEYIQNNQRVSIDYKITASRAISSNDIKMKVMLDSGRNVEKPAGQFEYDPLLSDRYYPAFDYTYKPYSATRLGGDINQGITRDQNVSFDLRDNEKTIDLKFTYKGETRLVRITR